ncbi:MAG: DNA glycosylase, partial [Jatrophihabitans sp.]
MPEGDTVWLTARRLDGALSGQVVIRSDVRVPQLATVDLRGRAVTQVVPRGKHLLTRFDDGTTLHSHLRMDGSYDITPARHRSHRYPDHLIRILLANDSWQTTGYRIHDLRLLPTREESQLIGHLGPDLLGPDWDEAEAARRLGSDPDVPIG